MRHCVYKFTSYNKHNDPLVLSICLYGRIFIIVTMITMPMIIFIIAMIVWLIIILLCFTMIARLSS